MEHHFRPKAHWTELPKLRERHEPTFRAHGYRVVEGMHLFALFRRSPAD